MKDVSCLKKVIRVYLGGNFYLKCCANFCKLQKQLHTRSNILLPTRNITKSLFDFHSQSIHFQPLFTKNHDSIVCLQNVLNVSLTRTTRQSAANLLRWCQTNSENLRSLLPNELSDPKASNDNNLLLYLWNF